VPGARVRRTASTSNVLERSGRLPATPGRAQQRQHARAQETPNLIPYAASAGTRGTDAREPKQ